MFFCLHILDFNFRHYMSISKFSENIFVFPFQKKFNELFCLLCLIIFKVFSQKKKTILADVFNIFFIYILFIVYFKNVLKYFFISLFIKNLFFNN